jgi:hypothetical protein
LALLLVLLLPLLFEFSVLFGCVLLVLSSVVLVVVVLLSLSWLLVFAALRACWCGVVVVGGFVVFIVLVLVRALRVVVVGIAVVVFVIRVLVIVWCVLLSLSVLFYVWSLALLDTSLQSKCFAFSKTESRAYTRHRHDTTLRLSPSGCLTVVHSPWRHLGCPHVALQNRTVPANTTTTATTPTTTTTPVTTPTTPTPTQTLPSQAPTTITAATTTKPTTTQHQQQHMWTCLTLKKQHAHMQIVISGRPLKPRMFAIVVA